MNQLLSPEVLQGYAWARAHTKERKLPKGAVPDLLLAYVDGYNGDPEPQKDGFLGTPLEVLMWAWRKGGDDSVEEVL